jgi:lysyl-tRNA synthetase class II
MLTDPEMRFRQRYVVDGGNRAEEVFTKRTKSRLTAMRSFFNMVIL